MAHPIDGKHPTPPRGDPVAMLILTFCLCMTALILQSVLCPPFTLLAFVPWIAFSSLYCSPIKALWLSCIAGAILDLLSEDPMGVHALNYCLTTWILLRWRNHFLYSDPLHLSLVSCAASFISTSLQWPLLFLFDRRVPFAGKWLFSDFLCMPIVDGLYALIWIAAPLLFYSKLQRHGSLSWQHIKQRLFPTSP